MQGSCCSTARAAAAWQPHARRWWSEQHQQQADSAAAAPLRHAPGVAAPAPKLSELVVLSVLVSLTQPRPPFFEGTNCQDLGGGRPADGCRSMQHRTMLPTSTHNPDAALSSVAAAAATALVAQVGSCVRRTGEIIADGSEVQLGGKEIGCSSIATVADAQHSTVSQAAGS